MSLREDVIRLAYHKPSLRSVLLPLLTKQAVLKGWKKGQVPIAMGKDEKEPFMAYESGATYGVWGISKRASGWTVTHIPSGMAAYHAKDEKTARAFVEAVLVTEPKLVAERNPAALTSTYKFIFLQLRQARPAEWPTLAPGVKIPNPHFEYEGGFPLKVLKDTQLPLEKPWMKVLRDIAEKGTVPFANYPEKTIAKMHVKDLVKYTGRGGMTWTPKGEQSYKDGFITGKFYVEV